MKRVAGQGVARHIEAPPGKTPVQYLIQMLADARLAVSGLRAAAEPKFDPLPLTREMLAYRRIGRHAAWLTDEDMVTRAAPAAKPNDKPHAPRVKLPPCPECGGKAGSQSSPVGKARKLKCRACGHNFVRTRAVHEK